MSIAHPLHLNYITLDQLMASVESDFHSFADNSMIDRGDIVKVVRRVNEDIGLKLNREYETIIEIENFKGDLPMDFMSLQMAIACDVQHVHIGPGIHGTHTIETNVPVVPYTAPTCMNSQGGCFWVTQQYKDRIMKFDRLIPLKLTSRAAKRCTENCINFNWEKAGYDIDIVNNEVITGFREGKVYISYLSDMVDEEGNLLLLDHALVNEYYEYAVKKQLLENFMMNNDADVSQKLGYIKGELRDARIRAMNFVTTPEYDEITNMYQANRRRFYDKYHKIIQ